MIKQYLSSKRAIIKQSLLSFLHDQKQEAKTLECDVIDFLEGFVTDGKLYRGSLVFLGFDLFSEKKVETFKEDNGIYQLLVKLALVLELTHSALLLHDDVMDGDDYRRGNKTFNCLMSEIGEEKGIANFSHFGNSLAICLGDLLLFWSNRMLTEGLLSYSDKNVADQINQLFNHEMELTVWGQMDDVCLAAVKDQVDEELIYHLYSLKSGHYSILNPLLLGATVAGVSKNNLQLLTALALDLGIIFQIKDDYINLFGDSSETGKPIGSDIKENKKTIYRNLLLDMACKTDRDKLLNLFGNHQLTEAEIDGVKQMIKKYGVVQEVEQVVTKLEKKINQNLDELNLSANSTQLLKEFIQLIITRDR
ncbi:MAG: Polyprenyl synthetase superfamily [Microgenomates bacterium 39_7]|nr:MAG: Polyprenyl synthetase superfamily [Microgenomates bacterium 39_7]